MRAMVLERPRTPLVERDRPDPTPGPGEVRLRVLVAILSVANLTRRDAREFMAVAAAMPLEVTATPCPLARANEALDDLRAGCLTGAAVRVP